MGKKTYQIQEIGEVIGGGTPSTKIAAYWDGDIAWISPADLSNYNNVYIEKGKKNITQLGLKKSSTVLLPPNTVLLTSRAPIGYIALAKNSICTNQGFKSIICNSKVVDYKYLYYYLQQSMDYIKLFASGATFPELSGNRLKRIKITIEQDVLIQKKIASILSAYDDLIENNNKRIKILEQMAENLYKEWFVRFRFPGYETAEFENGIPKGWEVVRVKNCLKRLPFNRLYKQDELESSGKVIVIDQSSNEFMGYHNNEPSHYASFEEPIILFGDHSCKFVLMTKNFSLGENVVPFKSISTEELDNYYLYYAVHKLIVTEEYKRHWGRFTAMKIFKPQIALQRKFADFVKQLVHQKEMLWIQNQNLIKQRDLLLPRIMSGKLEV